MTPALRQAKAWKALERHHGDIAPRHLSRAEPEPELAHDSSTNALIRHCRRLKARD